MIWGIGLSFTNKAIGGTGNFIGFTNYIKLLKDPTYRDSIMVTLKFTVFSLIFKLFFGTVMALMLNVEFKGRNLVRALLLIPWTLPNVVAVLNWKWLFSSTGGIVNYLMKSAGLIEKDIVRDGDAGSDYDCDCQCVEGDSFLRHFNPGKAADNSGRLL